MQSKSQKSLDTPGMRFSDHISEHSKTIGENLVRLDFLMDNIELPPEDVKTLTEETKSIYNSLKFSCDGEYDNFDDIMDSVHLHASQVISIMSEGEKHG